MGTGMQQIGKFILVAGLGLAGAGAESLAYRSANSAPYAMAACTSSRVREG